MVNEAHKPSATMGTCTKCSEESYLSVSRARGSECHVAELQVLDADIDIAHSRLVFGPAPVLWSTGVLCAEPIYAIASSHYAPGCP